jgi:hypothetical protein
VQRNLAIAGIAEGIAAHLRAQGTTIEGLRQAIAEGRPLVREAWEAQADKLQRLSAADREDLLRWGQAEYMAILRCLNVILPEHAMALWQAYHTYLVPQIEQAKELLRSQGGAAGAG